MKMKDYANPLLLLVVIILMACRAYAEPGTAAQLDVWLFTLCITGMLVDGALALAKALTRRPSLMSVVWSVAYLILGCCNWAMQSIPLSEEQAIFQEQQAAADPLARDAEGETLLSRAAALGKVDTVRKILNDCNPDAALICEAGLRAAECNKPEVLDALARVGMSAASSVDGVPLLHAAAQNGACNAMEWLLRRGAQVNERDAEGNTALIQATISNSKAAVKLLLNYGADIRLRDTTGKTAADYARDEELENLLTPPQPTALPQP